MSKGTFFNYFENKAHVLETWYRELTLEALRYVEESTAASAPAAITALAVDLARRAADEPELWDAKAQTAVDQSRLLEEEAGLDSVLREFFVSRLRDGIARGELAKDLDVQSFSGLIIAVLTGTGHTWVVSGHAFDLATAMRERVEFLFRAAEADGGQK